MAKREHTYCEDSWYSCPLSKEGCANDLIDRMSCNCGAEKHNETVNKVYFSLLEIVNEYRIRALQKDVSY